MILVGTHADVCEERHLQECVLKLREELLSQPGFPVIKDSHMLCACEESESISRLRKAIYRELIEFKVIYKFCFSWLLLANIINDINQKNTISLYQLS